MNTFKVTVSDSVKITDKLGTNKRWFNGMHFFYMVKVIPINLRSKK